MRKPFLPPLYCMIVVESRLAHHPEPLPQQGGVLVVVFFPERTSFCLEISTSSVYFVSLPCGCEMGCVSRAVLKRAFL